MVEAALGNMETSINYLLVGFPETQDLLQPPFAASNLNEPYFSSQGPFTSSYSGLQAFQPLSIQYSGPK